MSSRLKSAFAALWFFLPLVAFRNWQVRHRLPARLGVHFDLAGRPNIWISRESGLARVLLLMAVILAAATLVRSHLFPPMSSPRAVLGVFYLALGAIYCGVLSAFVLTGVAVMAWSGFPYFFSPRGVEIRTLSFHLYSVPAGQIKDYAVAAGIRWADMAFAGGGMARLCLGKSGGAHSYD